MARKYNRSIKLLGSWIADLQDESKEFTDGEKWQVILALAKCQISGNTGFLHELPREIKRGISVSTLIEQSEVIIEKSMRQRMRGKLGGEKTKALRDSFEEQRKRDEEFRQREQLKCSREEYDAMVAKGLIIQ